MSNGKKVGIKKTPVVKQQEKILRKFDAIKKGFYSKYHKCKKCRYGICRMKSERLLSIHDKSIYIMGKHACYDV